MLLNIILLGNPLIALPRSIKTKCLFYLEFKLYRQLFAIFQCDDEITVSILF